MKAQKDRPTFRANASAALIEAGMLTVALAAVAVSLFFGWRAMQPDQYDVTAAGSAVQKSTISVIPALKLNQEHSRRGQEIKVDQSAIGKADPFK